MKCSKQWLSTYRTYMYMYNQSTTYFIFYRIGIYLPPYYFVKIFIHSFYPSFFFLFKYLFIYFIFLCRCLFNKTLISLIFLLNEYIEFFVSTHVHINHNNRHYILKNRQRSEICGEFSL